jgi:hypothetical protein
VEPRDEPGQVADSAPDGRIVHRRERANELEGEPARWPPQQHLSCSRVQLRTCKLSWRAWGVHARNGCCGQLSPRSWRLRNCDTRSLSRCVEGPLRGEQACPEHRASARAGLVGGPAVRCATVMLARRSARHLTRSRLALNRCRRATELQRAREQPRDATRADQHGPPGESAQGTRLRHMQQTP